MTQPQHPQQNEPYGRPDGGGQGGQNLSDPPQSGTGGKDAYSANQSVGQNLGGTAWQQGGYAPGTTVPGTTWQGPPVPGIPLQGPPHQRPHSRSKGGLIAIVLVSCVLVTTLVVAGVLFITSRHSDPFSAKEATEALRNVEISGIGPVDEVEGPIRYADDEPLQFESTQCQKLFDDLPSPDYMSHTSTVDGASSMAFIELSVFPNKASAQHFYDLHLERNRKGCDGEAIDAAVTGLDFREDGRVSGAQYVTFTAHLADPVPRESYAFTRITYSNLVFGIYFASEGEPVSAEAVHETVVSIIDAVQ